MRWPAAFAGTRTSCRFARALSIAAKFFSTIAFPFFAYVFSVARLIASMALSRGITPDSAKKHVCRMVFTREPRPRPDATPDASMTWSLSFLSTICCCTSRGISFQTSSGAVGAVDEHRGARRGCRQRVELVEEVELVDADEVRRLQQIRRADGAAGRTAGARSCRSRTSSSRRRSSPAHGVRGRRPGSSSSSCSRRRCRRRRGRRTARARRPAARCRSSRRRPGWCATRRR